MNFNQDEQHRCLLETRCVIDWSGNEIGLQQSRMVNGPPPPQIAACKLVYSKSRVKERCTGQEDEVRDGQSEGEMPPDDEKGLGEITKDNITG